MIRPSRKIASGYTLGQAKGNLINIHKSSSSKRDVLTRWDSETKMRTSADFRQPPRHQ